MTSSLLESGNGILLVKWDMGSINNSRRLAQIQRGWHVSGFVDDEPAAGQQTIDNIYLI